MPAKQFIIDEQLTVTVTKRRSSRHLRLTVAPDGSAKVSIPAWAPYKTGLDFAKTRKQWIVGQRQAPRLLMHNQAVGKAHHLQFITADVPVPRSRVLASTVAVHHPAHVPWYDAVVQKQAELASIRALRQQAQSLLPQRLAFLAAKHNFSYTSVAVKQLKSRWGSCDSQQNIVLSLYLMQLPWECIDYVLMHELTHTQIMRHGPDFWRSMETVLPETKILRKQLRAYQPVVQAGLAMS